MRSGSQNKVAKCLDFAKAIVPGLPPDATDESLDGSHFYIGHIAKTVRDRAKVHRSNLVEHEIFFEKGSDDISIFSVVRS